MWDFRWRLSCLPHDKPENRWLPPATRGREESLPQAQSRKHTQREARRGRGTGGDRQWLLFGKALVIEMGCFLSKAHVRYVSCPLWLEVALGLTVGWWSA